MVSRFPRAAWPQAFLAFAFAAALTACGGGGGGDDSESPPAAQTLTLTAKTDKSYAAIKGRAGSSVEVWRDANGDVTQSLYTNPSTGERVRVFNDADGMPERVVDEASGSSMTITRNVADRFDYRLYDAAGNYTSGYAVLVKPDGLYAAPIVSTPAIEGQLSAQMNGATRTGSFTLLPATDAGLGTLVPFSAASLAFVDALPAPSTAASKVDIRKIRQSLLGIDRRAVLGGLAMGLAVGAASSALPGIVAGAMAAFALQYIGLPIWDGVNNATSLEQMSDNLNTFLDRFDQGASATTTLGDTLAGVVSSRVGGATQRAFDAARDVASAIVDRASLPDRTARAPIGDTSVSGFGVDQDGTDYTLAGSVGAAGAVTAVATADTGGASISIDGTLTGSTLSGTMSGRLGAGTVTGSVSALGQCAALQQSGGQGTFSFAFDAGAPSGVLTFYREAYTIPDGFRVVSNGVVLYDTGGLVSGSESVPLTLNGNRVLFVTVNAPNSGTAWDLSVGCPL